MWERNVSIKGQHKNLSLIKALDETKPACQERICLKAKMAKRFQNAVQMALFLWAPEHEDIQRSTFHIIITCQLARKWLHICLINVGFPSYCAFRDSYHSVFSPSRRIIRFSFFVNIRRRKKKRHLHSPCLCSVSHKPLTKKKILTFPLYLQDFAYIRCLTL